MVPGFTGDAQQAGLYLGLWPRQPWRSGAPAGKQPFSGRAQPAPGGTYAGNQPCPAAAQAACLVAAIHTCCTNAAAQAVRAATGQQRHGPGQRAAHVAGVPAKGRVGDCWHEQAGHKHSAVSLAAIHWAIECSRGVQLLVRGAPSMQGAPVAPPVIPDDFFADPGTYTSTAALPAPAQPRAAAPAAQPAPQIPPAGGLLYHIFLLHGSKLLTARSHQAVQ